MTAGILRWAWLVGWLLVERVAGQVVTVKAVVNSTGKTAPTSTNARCSRGISYQESGVFPQGTYLLATRGSSAPATNSNQYLFASNGTQLAKLDNLGIQTVVEAVGMSQNLVAYICSSSAGQTSLKVTMLNGVYSMEQISRQNLLTLVMAIWVEPNTEYTHYVRDVPTCAYSRWKLSSSSEENCMDSICRNPPSFYSVQDQILVYGACSTPVNLAYLERTTGNILKSLSVPSGVYSHIRDPSVPLKIYSASYEAIPVQYLTAIDTSVMSSTPAIELYPRIEMMAGDSLNSQLMIFKEFGYLAFFVQTSSGGFLRLVDTRTFLYSPATRFSEVYFPFLALQNNVQGLQLLKRRRLYFGLQAQDTGSNFQSFYLNIDLCQKVGVDRCAACPVGYYVSPAINAPVAPAECFPVGFGKSWVSPTVSNLELEPCPDPHCVECAQNITTCTKCKAQNNTAMFLFRGACIFSEQIPPAWGVAAGQQQLEPCADANCRNCSVDHNTCTVCQESDGFTLIDSTCTRCKQVRPMFVVRTEPAAGADVTIDMYSNPALKATKLFHRLKQQTQLNVTITDPTDPSTPIQTDNLIMLESSSYGFTISLVFGTRPPLSRFRLRVSTENFTFTVSNTTNLSCTAIQPVLGIFDLDPPQCTSESIVAAIERGKLVGGPISIMTADHPVGASVQTLASLFDTSGAFGLVGRSAPLISRLAFINIKFGTLLQAFLENSRYSVQDTNRNTVLHSDGTKGKITLYRLPLSVAETLFWKVLIYAISWVNLLVLRSIWKTGDVERNISALVKYHYFSHKLHFVAFCLCLPDATFILPRTIFDSKRLSFTYYAFAFVVWCLLSYDVVLIFTHLTTPWKMMKVLHENIGEFRVIQPKPAKKTSDDEEDEQNQPQTKQINYKKTYFNIDNNIHLLASITGVYKIDQKVAGSFLCQSLILCSWMRLIILQELGILACQYCVKLGLSFVLVFESVRVSLSIMAHYQYKCYRSVLVLVIDIVQAISFIYFVGVCLLISDSPSNSSVNLLLQQFTIWFLTIGVLSEYFLTVIYIILCFRHSKMSQTTMTKLKLEKVNSGWLKFRSPMVRKPKSVTFHEATSSANGLLDQPSLEKPNGLTVGRKSKKLGRNKRSIPVRPPS